MIIFLFTQVYSSFISSSSIDSCTNNGISLNCSKMLTVTMTLDNLQANGTEILEATLTKLKINNTESSLQYPIKLSMQKSKVKSRYPINYLQDFNSQAKELLIPKTVFDCQDGADCSNPTCGWKHDPNNQKIWDSQGYCCTCDFQDFLGLDNGSYERGYSCKAFNLGTGSATAFCLVWDDLWYSAYEILQYDIYYEITVSVTAADYSGNYKTNTYKLASNKPVVNSQNIILKIIGDFQPSDPPPVLESLVLMTPSKPLSHYMVLVGSPYWMAVDRTMISFDGTVCNKIGTSYTGFRSQPNKCSMQVGSCFKNQLNNLHNTDITRIGDNKSPLYFISRFGNFSLVTEFNQRYLEMNIEGSYSSLITLTMQADDLKFITSVSKGVIDFFNISDFEALTLDGVLIAQISNVGNVAALFVVYFNCSDGVSPIKTFQVSLKPMESRQITDKVYVDNLLGRQYWCNATILNSIGEETDRKSAYFNTSDSVTNEGSQGGSGIIPKGVFNVTKDNIDLSCDDYCPAWYNVPCFFIEACWNKILEFLSILLVILVAGFCFKCLFRRYGCCFYKCFRICKKENRSLDGSTFEDSGYICYFNSAGGFKKLGINEAASLKGKMIATRTGNLFVSDLGKKYCLSSSQVERYISSSPKYKKIES